MQISGLTFLVTALLVNLSLGSPIVARNLEARDDSLIAARRLEIRDDQAPPLDADCSKYRFKPVGEKKEDKKLDRMCPMFCAAIKKHPDSPTSKLFEQKLRSQCAVPPPTPA
ncbi:hypothetical protein TWF730_002263 [Orbilia blumenaviensis]|uniref:Uncharacterized protein n=1 Tax=Orbilia blumenaviensis TaxID=1796055 RepID=A0AAV9UA38_9PEZI